MNTAFATSRGRSSLEAVAASLGGAIAIVSLVACGSGGESPTRPDEGPGERTVRLVAVSGDGQADTVGQVLADSLVVRAELEDGSPFQGMGVTWELEGPVGRASPSRMRTNGAGLAMTSWQLGRTAGAQGLRAVADSGASYSFIAYAYPDRPARVTITPSELPTLGMVGDTLWLNVEVRDHYGNPTVPFEWASSDSSLVTIDGNGILRVLGSGDAFIIGLADAVAESVTVRVLPFQRANTGGGYVCGLSSGQLYCMGGNARGELGDGTTTDRRRFTPIMSGVPLADVSAGAHTCAVTPGGQAYCWGPNSYGELGSGRLDFEVLYSSVWPLEVTGGHSWSRVSTGVRFTCGLTAGGEAYCWGQNGLGQLGRDTLTATCANSESQRCSNTPIPVDGGLQFQSIDANLYACGIATSGAAYCWGANDAGQLGNADAGEPCGTLQLTCSRTPVAVDGGLAFAEIAVGSGHACALTAAGEAYCWGIGGSGQLGDGLASNSAVPVAVAGNHQFIDLSLDHISCGVTISGELYCWGLIDQWPVEEAHTPYLMDEDHSYMRVSVGGHRACALTVDDALVCLPH